MVNYRNTKIFKIYGNNGNFVGYTTQKYITSKLESYKRDYKRYKVGKLKYNVVFDIVCDDKCTIQLLEEYPCKTKQELNERILYWTNSLLCVNQENSYVCEYCKKEYKHISSLSRHVAKYHETIETNKKDKPIEDKVTNNTSHKNVNNNTNVVINKDELIIKLIEQNQQLMEQSSKMMEKVTKMKIVNNTINNNNISINVFLNEHCKDAMNLSEFIKTLNITHEDILCYDRLDYVDNVTNIFMKNLKKLKDTERPIHCSDQKRLQFYVKDDNEWNKDQNYSKINKAINSISHKQMNKLREWKQNHPNWNENDTLRDEYMNMIKLVAGSSENDEINKDKKEIYKKIGKELIFKQIVMKH